MTYEYVNGEPIADKLTDEQIIATNVEVGASYRSLWLNGVKTTLPDDHNTALNAVRLCVAWLEAQPRTATSKVDSSMIRVCIEAWSGVKIDCSAVWAAAILLGFKDPLHPTISKRFTVPHFSRIAGNPLAFFSTGEESAGSLPDTRWMIHHGYCNAPDIVGDQSTAAERIRAHRFAEKRIIAARTEPKAFWVYFYHPGNTGEVFSVETVMTKDGLRVLWDGKKLKPKAFKVSQNSHQWAFECKQVLDTKNVFIRLYDTRAEAQAALADVIKGGTKEKGLDPDTQPNLKNTFNTCGECSCASADFQEKLNGGCHE